MAAEYLESPLQGILQNVTRVFVLLGDSSRCDVPAIKFSINREMLVLELSVGCHRRSSSRPDQQGPNAQGVVSRAIRSPRG